MIAARRPRRPSSGRDDAGTTLLEILVATSVMAIVMAMFTTGVVRMYRSAQITEAISTARSQLTVAFGRLDRQVRYARQLAREGVANGHWYVEYLTDPIGGPKRCGQLRVPQPRGGPSAPAGRLETRTWVHGADAYPEGLCVDGGATPVPGAEVRLQKCASPPVDHQRWIFNTNVNFEGVKGKSGNGFCWNAKEPGQSGFPVVLGDADATPKTCRSGPYNNQENEVEGARADRPLPGQLSDQGLLG